MLNGLVLHQQLHAPESHSIEDLQRKWDCVFSCARPNCPAVHCTSTLLLYRYYEAIVSHQHGTCRLTCLAFGADSAVGVQFPLSSASKMSSAHLNPLIAI